LQVKYADGFLSIPEHIDPPSEISLRFYFFVVLNHKQFYGRKNKTNEPSKTIIAVIQGRARAQGDSPQPENKQEYGKNLSGKATIAKPEYRRSAGA